MNDPIPPSQPMIRGGAASEPHYYAEPHYYGGMPGFDGGGGGGGGESSLLGEFSLSRMIHVLRRKWFAIVCALALALAGAYYVIRKSTPIYQTASVFELYLRGPRITDNTAIIDRMAGSSESFNTFFEKLKGSAIKARSRTIVREDSRFKEGKITDTKMSSNMAISFRRERDSRLIRIIVKHENPELAAAFANAHVKAVTQITFEENRDQAENAVSWLKAQAVTMRENLEKTDEELLRFREASDIESLENQQKTLAQAVQSINGQMLSFESKAALENEVVNFLSTTEITTENIEELPSSVAQAEAMQESLSMLTAAINKRRALLIKYTDRHPEVMAQDSVVEVHRNELAKTIQASKTQAKANLEFLQKQSANLRKKHNALNEQQTNVNLKLVQAKMQLSALERDREARDIAYRGILNRIEEARLAADEHAATVKMVEEARPSYSPISPNKSRIIYMAISIGILAGLALALLSDRMEDFIWTAADVENGLGLKIIGLVPTVRGKLRNDLAILCHKNKNSLLAEAFAGIRGALTSGVNKGRTSSLLLTSSTPQEGKTICASNLAIMYAQSGIDTVLIDLDLRIPRIHHIFGLNGESPNLIEAIADQDKKNFDGLIQSSGIDNLSLICSLPVSHASPAELLGSATMTRFIQWAKDNFEQVIIDSPPFGAVSDSAILGGMVDGVILVARERKSRKASVRRAISHFRDCGANILGTVINDIPFRDRKYGYYGAYGHYQTYYSSYTPAKSKKK